MRWAYHIKNKLGAAAVLLFILAIILLNNIHDRANYTKLDKSITSIYKDRLMPATYLYELSNHLYKKKLLEEHANEYTVAAFTQLNMEHDKAIASLIKSYDATLLTKEEKQHWIAFKSSLENYTSNSSVALFDKTLHELDELTRIQAGVGKTLEADSKDIIDSSVMPSYLENALLIILGIISLVLISLSDKALFSKMQQSAWN